MDTVNNTGYIRRVFFVSFLSFVCLQFVVLCSLLRASTTLCPKGRSDGVTLSNKYRSGLSYSVRTFCENIKIVTLISPHVARMHACIFFFDPFLYRWPQSPPTKVVFSRDCCDGKSSGNNAVCILSPAAPPHQRGGGERLVELRSVFLASQSSTMPYTD